MGQFNNTVIDAQESYLEGLWCFNQTLEDQTGNHDLTGFGSMSYPSGKHKEALYLTYGEFAYLSSFSPGATDIAVSMWVYPSNDTIFLQHGDSLPGLTIGYVYNDDCRFYVGMMDDSNELHMINYSLGSAWSWTHLLVATYNSYLYFFVNGIMVGSVKYNGTIKEWDRDPLKLGIPVYSSSTNYIDTVGIWVDPVFATTGDLCAFAAELYNDGDGAYPVFLYRSVLESVGLADTDTLYKSIYELAADAFSMTDEDTGLWSGTRELAETVDFADSPIFQWFKEVLESLGLADSKTSQLTGGNVNEEVLRLIDAALPGWVMTVEESVSLVDSHAIVIGILAREFLQVGDSIVGNWSGTEITEESIRLSSAGFVAWLKTVEESLSLTDSITSVSSILVQEWLRMEDIDVAAWNGSELVAEALYMGDNDEAVRMYLELIADGFSIVDALSQVISVVVRESIAFALVNLSLGTFTNTNEETLSVLDSTMWSWLKEVQETLSLSDTMSLGWTILCQLAESVGLADAATPVRTTFGSLSESLQLAIAQVVQMTLSGIINETLNMDIDLDIDGTVYQCWVLNTGNFHASVYSGFDFNSYAEYNGITLAAKADGIYQITGDTDQGADIHSGIALPTTTFSATNQKRLRKAHFGISGTCPSLRVETENGSKVYNIVNDRAKLSRDIKGKNITLKAQDFDELDFIELIPVILSRRNSRE